MYAGVDKAATPAERPKSTAALTRDLDRSRPLLLYTQRDSDSNKDIMASRAHAINAVAQMNIATSSSLIPQFHSTYLPRVFRLAMPHLVGDPDFPGQSHPRRKKNEHAPILNFGAWLEMMACNCCSQIRWDWDIIPGAWSLHFASEVNTSMTVGLKRALRRGGADDVTNAKLEQSLHNIYRKLHDGEYMSTIR